ITRCSISDSTVSAVVGTRAVLRCPNTSMSSLILVIWKIRPKSGSHCSLAYRADASKTDRTNCNERMTWESNPDHDPALQIHPVRLADEGNYTCEIATGDGTFCLASALIVLVPPVVTLTHDSNGIIVCQASAGKPVAEISWAQGNGHSTENKTHHINGTVTILSSMPMIKSTNAHLTCLVTHPAMNQTQTIELSSSEYHFSNWFLLSGNAMYICTLSVQTSLLNFILAGTGFIYPVIVLC
uniref:Ig-like domain-containing protein n=1 Tax=Chelonoidis abingdonii TaxID=106734 RepID=A0A8C0GZP1_CHEAB